ncbi:uncharacterized protein LOC128600621 [Ictalurus furcatus]|uniref:uncharacterized protein LOC128600621 n=1 Tax=Ictalurus furcatus TaxID=66913 RepID=UPI002350E167|nr:uncharacterized protein LOC128600621 [Ictalurus furcatus]
MMDIFQPKHNSEGHTCSTVHGEECRSPCIGDVGNLAIQTSKGDVHLQKPVNERQKSSFRTGSCKRQFKSPREGDNDDDNHETLAMIRQQLHGPGGPDGNMRVNQTESESHCSKTSLGNLKRCRDDHEDEEQTAFSQQPAKKTRLGSSEIFGLEISPGFGDMANLQRLNRRSMPSSESGEHKVQDKLSCDSDNGSNDYETFVMTYNQPPIPGGPDENPIVNQTDSEPECSNHEDEEEAGTSQQPAKKVWFASSESRLIAMLLHLTDIPNLKPVNRRQNPIVNQTDSEPECSNDEDEEEAGVSQQPAKKSKRKFL